MAHKGANSELVAKQFDHAFKKRCKKLLVIGDPMQLEFSQQSVINRLSNMQNALGKGQLVNQAKLSMKMGGDLETSKKYH